MKVALVLHIYQPPVQEESIVKQVATECYLPLIKLIKNRRIHRFTLNIPLSLLELMDRFGYQDWIADIKSLYDSDRIELTGSGAYHPLLTKLPQQLVEEQVSLNEYGLGYYFGSRQGFEGEPSIMIKNIQGFFPPELAVNNDLVDTLSDFGYKWFLSERTALTNDVSSKDNVFEIKNKGIKIVCRDRYLSNMISFKRDLEMGDIFTYLNSKLDDSNPIVIALDGEFFGHHFREGIYLLENLLDKIEGFGASISTVSDVVDEVEPRNIDGVVESCWGASDEEFLRGLVYPFWIVKDNVLQSKLWKLQDIIIANYLELPNNVSTTEFQTVPVWKNSEVSGIQDIDIQQSILKYILIHKYLHSDKFWWSSKKDILGRVLYNTSFVKSGLNTVTEMFNYYPNDDIKTLVLSKVSEIEDLLK